MEIKGNEALTPNKTKYLVDQIQGELINTQDALANQNFNTVSISLIDSARNELQNVLNKFLEKKGVITPSETSDAIQKMNALKKARLEKDYVLGLKKGTWFIIAIVGLSIGAYFYYKKRANG